MKKNLLHTPEGVRDIYNGECEEKLYIQNSIHSVIKKYGYHDIQTPSFEFFDIFNKERGSIASKNMYKLFDKEGNTLVLRPDMTPSIARCAAKYFENNTDPLRLCYIGNTFVNNSRYQGRLKEVTQAGCELINDNSITADAEMVALLIEALLEAGLNEFQVEIGHVGFFKGLVRDAGLSDEVSYELRQLIREKKIFMVEELLKEAQLSKEKIEGFHMLPQMFGDADILSKAMELTNDEMAVNAINHLKAVYELIKVYGFEKYVTFDLGMLSELDYYTGIIFQGFTYDVGEPIANGGRYDKLIGQFGDEKASIGFGITIDLLHQALKRQDIAINVNYKVKLIVCDEKDVSDAVRLATHLRKQGMAVSVSTRWPDNADEYEEILTVNADTLERYGI